MKVVSMLSLFLCQKEINKRKKLDEFAYIGFFCFSWCSLLVFVVLCMFFDLRQQSMNSSLFLLVPYYRLYESHCLNTPFNNVRTNDYSIAVCSNVKTARVAYLPVTIHLLDLAVSALKP